MAYQNIVGNRLAQAELTTSYATIYTAPAETRTYIKNIDICNTTTGTVRFYISFVLKNGTASAANAIFYNAPINGTTTVQWTGSDILTPGDFISVKASSAGVTVTVTGGEAT
jgi:hypothetical protein